MIVQSHAILNFFFALRLHRQTAYFQGALLHAKVNI